MTGVDSFDPREQVITPRRNGLALDLDVVLSKKRFDECDDRCLAQRWREAFEVTRADAWDSNEVAQQTDGIDDKPPPLLQLFRIHHNMPNVRPVPGVGDVHSPISCANYGRI